MIMATFGLTGVSVAANKAEQCKVAFFGNKVPLILTHGLNGNMLQLQPIETSLESVEGVIIDTFDYSKYADQWVDNPEIGPALGERIACWSKRSKELGGSGKVITVAHSMGGLAVRQSLYNINVVSALGLAINVAVPNLGSGSGTWCTLQVGKLFTENCNASGALKLSTFSDRTRKLPNYPKDTTVRAIAGDLTFKVGFINFNLSLQQQGDGIVDIPSATWGATSNTAYGGGIDVNKCESKDFNKGSCSHTNMLKSPEVIEQVKRSVELYLSATKQGSVQRNLSYSNMSYSLPSTWYTKMGNEPGKALVMADKSVCQGSNAQCPSIYVVDLASDFVKRYMPEMYAENRLKLGNPAPTSVSIGQIDGVQVTSRMYESKEPLSDAIFRTTYWDIPDANVAIVYNSKISTLSPPITPEMHAFLSSIRWK